MIHNGKIDKPKADGHYLTFSIHTLEQNGKEESYVIPTFCIWSRGEWLGETPQVWTDMPTVEELEGVLYVTDK